MNRELDSLRHIETQIFIQSLQEELSLESISYSQISRTLNGLPTDVLWEIFNHLLAQVHPASVAPNSRKVFLVDSTTVSLGKRRFPWAAFPSTKAGIKVHMKLCYVDDGDVYPWDFQLSPAKAHDTDFLDALITDTQATYIFDLRDEEISDLYRSRWQIELFFNHIKQHLKIKHLYAQRQQGVDNPMILARVAYLLNSLFKQKISSDPSLFEVIRLLKPLWFSPFRQIQGILEAG